MKKLRVFPTVRIKRIVPGAFTKRFGTVLLFLLLIPYFVTFLFGNLKEGGGEKPLLADLEERTGEGEVYVRNETAIGIENIPLERYVADKLARSIDSSFEKEALKAQAVLLRSGLLAQGMAGEEGENVKEIRVKDENYGEVVIEENMYEAVEQTAGIYLAYKERPVNGSYFAVSNGATRNGEELLLTEYPYLKKVSCDRDIFAPDYVNTIIYDENIFEKVLGQMQELPITREEILKNEKIKEEKVMGNINLYMDSADYVLYLEREGKYVSGEQFRNAFRLPSASLHLSKEEKKVTITTKGVGHGLGMSQFEANEMAREGKDYTEILNYFFADTTFRKFE